LRFGLNQLTSRIALTSRACLIGGASDNFVMALLASILVWISAYTPLAGNRRIALLKLAEFYQILFGWRVEQAPGIDYWRIQCAADTANGLNGGLTYRPFPGTAQLGALRSRGFLFSSMANLHSPGRIERLILERVARRDTR
jgi:hypothetical protein